MTLYNWQGCTKTLLPIILVVVILAVSVSALDFDNVKSYDKVVKKITITNAFGLGSKLAEYTLKENTDNCFIDCYAKGTATLYSTGQLFTRMRFNDGSVYKSLQYNIWLKVKDKWYEYQGESLNAGTYEWWIEGKKKPSERIDWIASAFGSDLNEWAWWNGEWAVRKQIKIQDNSGSAVSNFTIDLKIPYDSSMLSSYADLRFVNGSENSEYQHWLYFANASEARVRVRIEDKLLPNKNLSIYLYYNNSVATTTSSMNGTHIVGEDGVSFSEWTEVDDGTEITLNTATKRIEFTSLHTRDVAITQAVRQAIPSMINFTMTWIFDITTGGGGAGPAIGVADSALGKRESASSGFFGGQSTTDFALRTFFNTAPIQDYKDGDFTEGTVYYAKMSRAGTQSNVTVYSDSAMQTIVQNFNVTYNDAAEPVTYAYMLLGIDGGSGATVTTGWITNYTLGKYVPDLSYTIGTEEVAFIENSRTYVASTSEGKTNEFKINITLNAGDTFTSAVLVYNNTNYTSSAFSAGGNQYVLTNNVQTPDITTDTSVSFHWIVTLGSGQYSSTSSTQTVLAFAIGTCGGAYNTTILNYTLKDEQYQSVMNGTNYNTSIEVDVNIYPVDSSVIALEYSHHFNVTNPAQVCVNTGILNVSSYRLYTVVQYQATAYAHEFHHIQNYTLNNNTIPQNIDLFDLLSSDSTEFKITYKDDNFLPVEEALINIQRRYISDGVFKSVEVLQTDSNGQTVGHFDTDGVLYSITVTKEGKTLATFDNIAVICENALYGDCKINLNALSTGIPTTDFETSHNLNYLMSFNSGNRSILVTFNTLDGSSSTVMLNVTKFDRFGGTNICSNSLLSSSGSISCHIPMSQGNLTLISELYSNGELIITRLYSIIPSPAENFGTDGVVMVLVLILTIPLMFISSPIGIIIGIFLGLIMAGGLLLFTGGSLIGTGSAIVWAIIAGGIIIWKINQDR